MILSKAFYAILSIGMCYGMSVAILADGIFGDANILAAILFATILSSIGSYGLIRILKRLKGKWYTEI